MKPLVVCEQVAYHYRDGTPALHRLDLTVEPGEFVILAGASGSGKSTLCRLLNGLIPHLHGGHLTGRLLVNGQDTLHTPPYVLSRQVGLVLQNPEAQSLATTVARDLALGPACQGQERASIAARIRDIAAMLAIEPLLDRQPGALSGGELQRVAIAGVLALNPHLLALDEPFAFLDAAGAAQLRDTLRLLHQRGVTIIVAEHRLGEVTDLATRLIVLHEGRVAADGAPRDVLAHDILQWGLEAPPLVRLARAAGIDAVPLTLDEAVEVMPLNNDLQHPLPTLDDVLSASPVIAWENVSFSYGSRTVLSQASLSGASRNIVGLLGANGSGKTTLLRLGNGLLRPQHGTVRLQGEPIGKRPLWDIARSAGLVVQHPRRMLFAPTVQEELEAGPRAIGRCDRAWIDHVIEQCGLEPFLHRSPHQLSAGEQRRVAIGAMLASRPTVLFLDEPTAGQDATSRRMLHSLITSIARDGMAVIIATHDTEWAYTLCSRWAVLGSGMIIAEDAPPAICARAETMARAHLRVPAIEALRYMPGRTIAHVAGARVI
ncbi:ABC transporter ATP-binding protein [Roseiflexus sp.]|uniref:ABC transporter ATP-binding protein n=1 Tax=Roseiflexus sp. TaxID=2562120 RepID=UPI00398AE449